jgi:hypothetical protein
MPSYAETFRTYANYVRAQAQLAGRSRFTIGPGALGALNGRIRAHAAIGPAGVQPDAVQTRASLNQAWGTELVLNITARYAQEDELIGLSNTWVAVQVYYTLYHSTQALLAAHGYKRPESHSKTQRMFCDLWITKRNELAPWSLGVGPNGVVNGPEGRVFDLAIHSWTGCNEQNCWDLVAKAVRTTRGDAVAAALTRLREAKFKERRNEFLLHRKEGPVPQPQLTAMERQKTSAGVRAYSILDFLYRLRIKSNYEEAAVFVEGPENTAQSRLLREDLVYLASASMLLAEIHIATAVGVDALRTWSDAWLAKNHPPGRPMGLKRRREFL